jgi:DDE superfamily endonuclease
MPLSRLPAFLATCFSRLAQALDPRSAARLPALLVGLLLARGRRTCTSWFRACGITDHFRRAYNVIGSCGRRADRLAACLLPAVDPLLAGDRLVVAFDDTPTERYGPHVEGAGVHHNPTPGPAGEKFVYGHVWVTLAALVRHPDRGTTALPLLSRMYVREKDIERLDPDRRVPFRTKLEMAAGLLGWLMTWRGQWFKEVWAVVDGGYSKRPFLQAARERGVVVVGRLPRNAALRGLPVPPPEGRRGRKPVYGKNKLMLKLRAGQLRGWEELTCRQYGRRVTKLVKTFLATWRPAGGLIRVVLVQEEDDGDNWRAYFCTKPSATAEEILEVAADRTAVEQTFKDVKEVWGAGQQQVRNLHANVGCFNLSGWMYSLVEAWAWRRAEEELVDREDSPWDWQYRRPSHADKRKAMQRQLLRGEIDAALAGSPDGRQFRVLAERLLRMAA